MKSLFFFVIFLYPILCFASIDERKIDVYYANGILTQRADAIYNTYEVLKPTIKKELYNNNESEMYKHIGNVKYAYNSTNGEILDLWESLAQKLNFQGLLDAIFETSHERDLHEQVTAYENSIKEGHKVLVVAHSQGNLFTAEALSKLDSWMQDYFYAISVASPKAFKIKSDTPHIAFDNDVVAWLGGVYVPIDNPNNEVGSIESHAFTYYMGLPSKDSNLSTNVAKDKIMNAVSTGISDLTKLPSQWVVAYENDTTQECTERRAILHHFKSAITPIDAAFPFNTDTKMIDSIERSVGKVYQVDDEYVLASLDGEKIDPFDPKTNDGKCYELQGTAKPDTISIENVCANLNAHSGILESSLSWKSAKIDLDLSVSFKGDNVGTRDIQSSEVQCPNEHWYIGTEAEVQAGEYYVSITNTGSGTVDESLLPETISFSVSAPDGGVKFTLEIANAIDLNMGQVAKVTVTKKEDNSIGVSVEPTEVVRSNSTAVQNRYVTRQVEVSPGIYVEKQYDYKTEALLNRANFGPIAGAGFEVSEFINPNGIIYSGATSSGERLEDNGLMLFSGVLKDAVEDDKLYLITVTGGQDVDVNDDFIMDDVATDNFGQIHAIVSGKDIKEGSLKVSITTEMAYQVLSKNSENNATKVQFALDKIAQQLFKEDINGDKIIDRTDLHAWLPGFDKDKLVVSYEDKIEPIVQKVYLGEDIYSDVNALIPSLVADAGEDMLLGDMQRLILDASRSYDLNGDIVEYSWLVGDSVLCTSDKPICEIDMLYVGTHSIRLSVINNNGKTDEDELILTVGYDAPIANAGEDQEIFETGEVILDASQSYDNQGNIVEYLWAVGDTVYCQGTDPVCIIENLPLTDYTFSLKVTDNEGFSSRDDINVTYPYKPVAIAGDDVSIKLGESASLDASSSYDSDGYIIEYQWSEGDVVYCSGPTPVCSVDSLSLGSHLLELKVKDDKGAFGRDEINVNVNRDSYIIGSVDTPNYSDSIAVLKSETIAYVTSGMNGIQIIDISNPFIPTIIGSYATEHYVYSIKLSADEKTMYIADGRAGLKIVDISNPLVPTLIGAYYTSGAYNITLSADETIIYVADGSKGVLVIDISDPSAPKLIGNYDTPGVSYDIILSADDAIAYVADANSGIQVLDVSDPSTPRLIGSYDTPDRAYKLALSDDGTILYVADGSSGLQIIDVSSPSLPSLISQFDTPGSAVSISLSNDGRQIYIADVYSGIQVIYVAYPMTPILRGSYDTPDRAWDIVLSKDESMAYVVDYGSGLQIIDVSPTNGF